MPMTDLAALYVSSGFQPSEESVRRVQEAGEATMEAWSADRVPVLTRLAMGFPTADGDELAWFLDPFQEADRTFTDVGDARKASVYASGLALALLRKQDSDAVRLALCILSASLSNKVPSLAFPDLAKRAQQDLAAVQQKWRLKPRLQFGEAGAPDVTALVQAADYLAAGTVPQAGAALKTFAGTLSKYLATEASQQSELKRLDTHLRLLDEEQAKLWWFIGGTSSDVKMPFSDLPVAVAAVLAGHELADLRHHTAGPVAAAALLDMSVKAGRKPGKVSSTTALAEACVDPLPATWRKTRGSKALDWGVLDLCPLSAAMLMSGEAGDAPDWRAAFSRRYPVADAIRLSTLELAMQAYRECCYLSSS